MFLLYPFYWEFSYVNGCWILSNTFSASIELIVWFLTFLLLIWSVTLIDLQMLNHPWSLEWILLDHNMILFMNFYLACQYTANQRMYIDVYYGRIIFCVVLVGFGIRVMLDLQNEEERMLPNLFFCKSFRRIGIKILIKCLVKLICEAFWSWTFVWGDVFNYCFNLTSDPSVQIFCHF